MYEVVVYSQGKQLFVYRALDWIDAIRFMVNRKTDYMKWSWSIADEWELRQAA